MPSAMLMGCETGSLLHTMNSIPASTLLNWVLGAEFEMARITTHVNHGDMMV